LALADLCIRIFEEYYGLPFEIDLCEVLFYKGTYESPDYYIQVSNTKGLLSSYTVILSLFKGPTSQIILVSIFESLSFDQATTSVRSTSGPPLLAIFVCPSGCALHLLRTFSMYLIHSVHSCLPPDNVVGLYFSSIVDCHGLPYWRPWMAATLVVEYEIYILFC